MKKRFYFSLLSIAMTVILSSGLLAQEKTEVTIQVKNDGKVIQDTTYQFNDAEDATNVMKMLGIMLGDEEHPGHITHNYTATISEDVQPGKMVFISKDGENFKVKEIQGDSLVWVSESESDGDHVKVMKYKIEGDDESHQGKHVIVMKSEDGNSFNILLDEDVDSDDADVEKEVTVVVSGDEAGEWKVIKNDDDDESEDVDVEVRVIKKIKKEEEK